MKKTNSMFWLTAVAFSAALGTAGCAAGTGDDEDLVAGEEMEGAGDVEDVGEAQDALTVSNNSFETGPAPGEFISLAAGSTAITGWTVGDGGIDYVGTLWVAKNGSRSLDLNSSSPGSISKTLTTVVGTTYTVKFWMAGNAGVAGVKSMKVTAASAATTYTFDTTGKTFTNMGWVQKTFTFKATSTTTTLKFKSNTAGVYGPALDGPITITP